MPRPTIITGIDIGSRHVKVVIAEHAKGRPLPRILGRGLAESRGLRRGYIVNTAEVTRSIRAALSAAQRVAGVEARSAYIAVGGVSLETIVTSGSVIASRADSEITELDVQNALDASEQAIPGHSTQNRKIIHAIPLEYKIDGMVVMGRPLGMAGARLEVSTLFITALAQHVSDLIQAVEDAGVSVLDAMAAPIAASFSTLTNTQKIAGCVLANIGAETVSIVVYENNLPISLGVFPLGSTDITHDIALGFQISLEEAEDVKIGIVTETFYPKKRVDEIIAARLGIIFELIESHLKKIGKSALLPAGIIITGGGGHIAAAENLARSALRLPSRIAAPGFSKTTGGELKDVAWAIAYGLCVWGANTGGDEGVGVRLARQTKNKILEWIKQFLP